MECKVGDGVHIWEDHYYVEIVETGGTKVLADGEEGELVLSTLTREALPMLRFRTGCTASVLSREECSCGNRGVHCHRLCHRSKRDRGT